MVRSHYKFHFFTFIGRLSVMLLICLYSAGGAYGQRPEIDFNATYLRDGTYEFEDTETYMEDELFTTYKEQFGLGNDDEMKKTQTTDLSGKGTYRVGEGHFYSKYEQYHKGYKVEGAHMNVMGQHGVALSANGFIMKGLDVNTDNPLSEADALAKALAHIDAKAYLWEDEKAEAEYREMAEDDAATFYPKGKLQIRRIEGGTEARDYKLVWVFSIEAATPAVKHVRIIDAITGAVLEAPSPYWGAQYQWGTVHTNYYGTQSIQTQTCSICPNFSLAAPSNARKYGWYCKLNSNGTSCDKQRAKDNDNNWSSSEDTRTIASAYWIADIARNYYVNKHGRWGSNYDGKLVWLKGNVAAADLANAGYAYEIDDWDEIAMRPDFNNPVAALDVIGHEITHGYIKFHSNVGFYKEDFDANAIKEGFADIFGQMVERSFTGNADWVFGNDMNVYNRYFAEPHNDWPVPSPRTYLEPGYWVNSGQEGWYRNSGILRRWFYLLSNRLGIEKADNIAYYTVNWWIWSNLNWKELRRQSVAEAKYDFGNCSKEHNAVRQSWYDVGLQPSYLPCTNIQVINPDVIPNPFEGLLEIFSIRGSFDDDIIKPGGAFEYTVPAGWETYREGDGLFVTSLGDNPVTDKVYVTYTAPDGSKYYSERVVHILDKDRMNKKGIDKMLPSAQNDGNSGSYATARISPNPASRSINITLPITVSNAAYTISDMHGRVTATGNVSGSNIRVALPSMASGLYIFKLKAGNYATANKLYIKQP